MSLLKRKASGGDLRRAAPEPSAGLQFRAGTSASAPPVERIHSAAGSASKPAAAPTEDAMWVDKHAPHCISDLAVHKKKIEEVQQWLQQDKQP